MSYYSEKIAEIRQTLQAKTSVPIFEPQKWKINNTPIFTNCYAYCLDLNVSDPNTSIFIPGSISNEYAEKYIYSLDTLLQNIKNDLQFLGISYRDNTGLLQAGEYRIGIYTDYIYPNSPISVHFVRQDSDGKWSEKFGWDGFVFREIETISDEPQNSGYTGCNFLLGSLILKLPTL